MFSNNRALSGAVFVFVEDSTLVATKACNATFQNNFALDYGGVIYIEVVEELSVSKTLLDLLSYASQGSEFRTLANSFIDFRHGISRKQLIFSGNTAGKGGDVVFGNSVL